MNAASTEAPVVVLGSTPDYEEEKLQEQIVPDNVGPVLDPESAEFGTVRDTSFEATALKQLTEKKNYWGFLDGNDATLYLRLMAPKKEQVDITSLMSKLSCMLTGNRQLERRARKLAWHVSKGGRVARGWDNIFLSELTTAESAMSDDEFVALYPNEVKTPCKQGGRPRKYRTAAAQRRGHAERQRRYRARKLPMILDVTKTPSQLVEK